MEHREKICSRMAAHALQRSRGAILNRFVGLDVVVVVLVDKADISVHTFRILAHGC